MQPALSCVGSVFQYLLFIVLATQSVSSRNAWRDRPEIYKLFAPVRSKTCAAWPAVYRSKTGWAAARCTVVPITLFPYSPVGTTKIPQPFPYSSLSPRRTVPTSTNAQSLPLSISVTVYIPCSASGIASRMEKKAELPPSTVMFNREVTTLRHETLCEGVGWIAAYVSSVRLPWMINERWFARREDK